MNKYFNLIILLNILFIIDVYSQNTLKEYKEKESKFQRYSLILELALGDFVPTNSNIINLRNFTSGAIGINYSTEVDLFNKKTSEKKYNSNEEIPSNIFIFTTGLECSLLGYEYQNFYGNGLVNFENKLVYLSLPLHLSYNYNIKDDIFEHLIERIELKFGFNLSCLLDAEIRKELFLGMNFPIQDLEKIPYFINDNFSRLDIALRGSIIHDFDIHFAKLPIELYFSYSILNHIAKNNLILANSSINPSFIGVRLYIPIYTIK